MFLWVDPSKCTPPHRVTRFWQAEQFAIIFSKEGWNLHKPVLIAYEYKNEIQLLSGTHRQAGSILAGLSKIPIIIRQYIDVYNAYGDLNKWNKIMKAPTVQELIEKD